MTKCYDCDKWFDIQPNEVYALVGYGDYCIEEADNKHFIVNLDKQLHAVLEDVHV